MRPLWSVTICNCNACDEEDQLEEVFDDDEEDDLDEDFYDADQGLWNDE